MLDGIIELWRNLPFIIKFPLDFFLTVVIMRGIVANEISNWLKEKGIMKDGVIHAIIGTGQKLINKSERRAVIWNHYKNEHNAKSILACHEPTCQVL